MQSDLYFNLLRNSIPINFVKRLQYSWNIRRVCTVITDDIYNRLSLVTSVGDSRHQSCVINALSGDALNTRLNRSLHANGSWASVITETPTLVESSSDYWRSTNAPAPTTNHSVAPPNDCHDYTVDNCASVWLRKLTSEIMTRHVKRGRFWVV